MIAADSDTCAKQKCTMFLLGGMYHSHLCRCTATLTMSMNQKKKNESF